MLQDDLQPDGPVNSKTFSLTGRLIASVVTCQILLAVGLSLVAVLYARQQLRGSFDTAMKGEAMGALALVRYTETKPPVLMFDATMLPPSSDEAHRDMYEITAADGQLIARSSNWTGVPRRVSQTPGRFADFMFAGVPYRAILLRNVQVLDEEDDEGEAELDGPPARVNVIFASPLLENRARLTRVALYVSGTSLLLLLAANAIAAWSIRRGLKPLHQLANQASEISVHHWDFRAPSGAKLARELSPLTNAIDAVLGRLKESFRQQRDFTNDAAHDLKTSVAIVKSTLQSLLQRRRTYEEYRVGLETVLEDCGRLEDLLNRMLRLARVEQLSEDGAPRKLATTELTSTCEAAISRIRPLADLRRVTLQFDGDEIAYVRADPEDLELLWLNLLENAVQYCPDGSTVQMRVHRTGQGVLEVSVIDDGPGIPADELPYIFERFRRGDPSRARATGGFGLGLAICKAVTYAYGGTIEAVNIPSGGTHMRVRLPIDPAEITARVPKTVQV